MSSATPPGPARPTLDVARRQFRRGVCRTHGVARVEGAAVVRADLTTVVRPAGRVNAADGA